MVDRISQPKQFLELTRKKIEDAFLPSDKPGAKKTHDLAEFPELEKITRLVETNYPDLSDEEKLGIKRREFYKYVISERFGEELLLTAEIDNLINYLDDSVKSGNLSKKLNEYLK